jgi:hypothetical protein
VPLPITRHRRERFDGRRISTAEKPSAVTTAHAYRALRVETRAQWNVHVESPQAFRAARLIAVRSRLVGLRSPAAIGATTANAPATASSARIMFQLCPTRCIGRGSLPETPDVPDCELGGSGRR